MPAPGIPVTYHLRPNKPLLGLSGNSPSTEAEAMLKLLEHGSTVEQVRDLICFPPKARCELLAAGVPASLVRKTAEFRERVLDLFEELREQKEKKARRALSPVRLGLDVDAAHVATVERFSSHLHAE